MKLLIVTQAVAQDDLVLGFFHRWLEEFAKKFERIEVVCLSEGAHTLPANVHVHSLGKERGRRHPLRYALRFLMLSWKLRRDYDAVFIHMNQEYLLLAGWLFALLRKPMYLWRNHYAGSLLTRIAAQFCTKVFYTSASSYTAKFKNSVQMPVGVDLARFRPQANGARRPGSILFFGRMAPSKRPGLVLDALIAYAREGGVFTASFVGSPLPKDQAFVQALRQRTADAGLSERITFSPGVPNHEAPNLFQAHELYINASPSGMLDKTVFEAAASGCNVLSSIDDWKERAGERSWFKDLPMLVARLKDGVPPPPSVAGDSLESLAQRLQEETAG